MKGNKMKVSNKLAKVNDNAIVHFLDNGFMVEISGRDSKDNYATSKILCTTVQNLYEILDEISKMEKD